MHTQHCFQRSWSHYTVLSRWLESCHRRTLGAGNRWPQRCSPPLPGSAVSKGHWTMGCDIGMWSIHIMRHNGTKNIELNIIIRLIYSNLCNINSNSRISRADIDHICRTCRWPSCVVEAQSPHMCCRHYICTRCMWKINVFRDASWCTSCELYPVLLRYVMYRAAYEMSIELHMRYSANYLTDTPKGCAVHCARF